MRFCSRQPIDRSINKLLILNTTYQCWGKPVYNRVGFTKYLVRKNPEIACCLEVLMGYLWKSFNEPIELILGVKSPEKISSLCCLLKSALKEALTQELVRLSCSRKGGCLKVDSPFFVLFRYLLVFHPANQSSSWIRSQSDEVSSLNQRVGIEFQSC